MIDDSLYYKIIVNGKIKAWVGMIAYEGFGSQKAIDLALHCKEITKEEAKVAIGIKLTEEEYREQIKEWREALQKERQTV